ncbi:hypothetical protein [Cystobacter ferrugineus]|uniref:Lipoprotein n=1 Tax=Cystobacter ferrugineus TaxID=83449 RepID=A0A1L9BJU1_9BACT|nr:hypothetical protein [Cystobacter ferrugineus]OJH42499.1 hypothetical protein BON30_04710 [Cystobacter ferrugineus]
MASRVRLGMMVVLIILLSLMMQACLVVPVPRTRPAYGYGGSGYYTDVDPREAQRECARVARDFRGYRGVRVGAVDVTGPETARVELRARTYGGYVRMGCTYDARTGRAYVP